jgi:hypothetical protein
MDDQWTALAVHVQVTGHDSNIIWVIYIGEREATPSLVSVSKRRIAHRIKLGWVFAG